MITKLRQIRDRIQGLADWRQLPPEIRQRYRPDRDRILGPDPGIEASVARSVEWLCTAQRKSADVDGGVARHFSIIDGWGSSYPETTGYIVPTMLRYARLSGTRRYSDAAKSMLDWLLSIQLPDGAFQGGTMRDKPVIGVVFNTGQILMGLSAGAVEFGEPYTTAMHRAAHWLVECIDDDGCWRRNQSPFALAGEKAYDTHTAWGLLEATRASGEDRYAEVALRNIRWATGKQTDTGWFRDCCLTDPQYPLTHTIGYALRGIIEGYEHTGDESLLASAQLAARGLLSAVAEDGNMPGRLDEKWRAAVNWSCLTGSVQIAHCWLQLYRLTSDTQYVAAARRVNSFVRRTLGQSDSEDTDGAIRGSFPIYGKYGQYQFLNWAAKFFIDSNMLEAAITQESR